jgi:hypothetical protein
LHKINIVVKKLESEVDICSAHVLKNRIGTKSTPGPPLFLEWVMASMTSALLTYEKCVSGNNVSWVNVIWSLITFEVVRSLSLGIGLTVKEEAKSADTSL